MQVKKKFPKNDFLKRFGFHTEETTPAQDKSDDDVIMMSGALQSSDVETDRHPETPPSSPPSEANPETKAKLDSHGPTVDVSLEMAADQPADPKTVPEVPETTQAVHVNMVTLSDSDDDLEIVPTKPKATTVFDRLPSNKARLSNPMLALKHLANLTAPSNTRHGKTKNMNFKELQVKLLQDARTQARKDKEERINELRARGIHVQTAEEREKEQLEVENALERARQDAEDLAKKEKSDGDDASDDEEWAEPNETDPEISGSEADADDEDGESEAGNPFFDQEAEDADESSDSELEDFDILRPKPASTGPEEIKTKAPKKRRVILDDDQDDESQHDQVDEPKPSSDSQKEHAIAAAGLGKSNAMDFGLSQIFAGTLADEDDESEDGDDVNVPFAPIGEPATPRAALDFGSRLVPDSHSAKAGKVLPIDLTPSQSRSQPVESPSKMSEMEFTQDVGFAIPRAPIGRQHVPPSTSETVLLASAEKKGKLRRRASLIAVLSDADDDAPDAFDTLFRGAKRHAAVVEFDKKKSAARNLVEEQAEESEDEYKGIGGASDDESGNEYDEEVAKMIEDGHVDVDEMEIAALHA
jgi:mediator of replication checkpoint protein 1